MDTSKLLLLHIVEDLASDAIDCVGDIVCRVGYADILLRLGL